MQQRFLSIAEEMPHVQTKPQSVIMQKVLAKAGHIAVCYIFQQQGDTAQGRGGVRLISAVVPVLCKVCQQGALQGGRALWRVQHRHARHKAGNKGHEPRHHCRRCGGGFACGVGLACGSGLGPGQVHRQVNMPAQGQRGQVRRQIARIVCLTGAGFKQAQAHLVYAACEKAGIFCHTCRYDKRGRSQATGKGMPGQGMVNLGMVNRGMVNRGMVGRGSLCRCQRWRRQAAGGLVARWRAGRKHSVAVCMPGPAVVKCLLWRLAQAGPG